MPFSRIPVVLRSASILVVIWVAFTCFAAAANFSGDISGTTWSCHEEYDSRSYQEVLTFNQDGCVGRTCRFRWRQDGTKLAWGDDLIVYVTQISGTEMQGESHSVKPGGARIDELDCTLQQTGVPNAGSSAQNSSAPADTSQNQGAPTNSNDANSDEPDEHQGTDGGQDSDGGSGAAK